MAIFNGIAIKLIITFIILLTGFIISRLVAALITSIQRKKSHITLKQSAFVRHSRYIIMILTLITAIIYLKSDIIKQFSLFTGLFFKIYEFLPNILVVVLAVILGIITSNLINFIIRRFLDTAGITEFMIEQNRENALNVIFFFIRIIIYFFMAIILLNIFDINISGFMSAFSLVFYILIGLLVLYIFISTRVFFENFIAGIYLKTSDVFKLGQKIRVDEAEGKIKSISNQGVTVKTDYGYNIFIPNKQFISKEISFKNIETDLDTLKKIKSYFVQQKPSYCGPASAAMILKIFGYNYTQTKIGDLCKTEVGKGTHPDKLIQIVQDLTAKKIRGAWIDVDHITDLKSEIRLWLNDGALVIVDYKKSMLFPDAKTAHYSVVVAVEGDELVILDPSGKKGGVYLAETEKVYRGMDTYSELIKGKRGYIVFAPEGTTAYHRLEEGLIYSDPNFYKDLSNKLKKELFKITEKSEMLESVLPMKVKSFIRKWKEKEKIARLWKPQKI